VLSSCSTADASLQPDSFPSGTPTTWGEDEGGSGGAPDLVAAAPARVSGPCASPGRSKSGSFPSACATRPRRSSPAWSGPNPGMPAGSVKSHWFSARPMKSRMDGSSDQARRRAALVSSAGTPDCRNARISLADVIESMGGRLAGSKAASEGSPAARSPVRDGVGAGGCGSTFRVASARVRVGSAPSGLRGSRFMRDQRARKVSGSLIGHPRRRLRDDAGRPTRRGRARA